jgi:LacI family transcriptional regulator
VNAAAKELGYVGSYHARTLVRGKAMTLGFVTRFHAQDMTRPGIETGMATEADERGYEILNILMSDGHAAIRRAVRYVEQGRIDGFAVFMGGWTRSDVAREIPAGVPVVHVWFAPDGFFPLVTMDPAPGIREAVEHLADLGHRRVVWLGIETSEGRELPDRLAAFREASKKAALSIFEHYVKMPARRPKQPDRTVSGFHERLAGKLGFLGHATAVLCYNDAMATGLSIALWEEGLGVPDDISLVGFDDIQATYASPPLTTISHVLPEMGRAAVRYLDELIQSGDERRETEVRVPSRLVVRRSTAPPQS